MPTVNHKGIWIAKGAHKATWTGLLNGDNGDNLDAVNLADKTVQITGTFGVGGTVIIEGSNDGGTTFSTLDDPQGTALSITVSKIKSILENVQLLRPRVTAGDGTTNINVYIVSRSNLR